MKNPLAKLAIAAAITIVGVLAFIMWTGTGPGIALADVLARMEKVKAYMYQISTTTTIQVPGGQTINQEIEATMLVSAPHGLKMTTRMRDPNSGQTTLQEMYMLPQKGVWVTVMPNEKKYMRMNYDETLAARQRNESNDPRGMVELILRCNYRSLGRSVVDGVEVEGFQTTDPNYLAGMLGQANVKIWVDVKTQLPVRSEQDVQTDQMRMHSVSHNFQWDVAASEADFEPVIPSDYTTLTGGPIKLPAVNEENAIKGLRLFADLAGRYPEKLDMVAVMSQMGQMVGADTPAAKRLREEMKGATDDQKSRKIVDLMMPIQGISTFHMTLVGGKKDPAYYGHVVTPQDTDQVLLRWKVSDNEYRVVFGDLHAETVTPEKLAELEAALPK